MPYTTVNLPLQGAPPRTRTGTSRGARTLARTGTEGQGHTRLSASEVILMAEGGPQRVIVKARSFRGHLEQTCPNGGDRLEGGLLQHALGELDVKASSKASITLTLAWDVIPASNRSVVSSMEWHPRPAGHVQPGRNE